MFSLMRRGWFRKTVIFVFAVPLMFLGGSFIGAVAERAVGKVGSLEIPRYEFLNRYQQSAEGYRRQYDLEEIPPELGEQIARQVQSQLLSEYLIRAAARDKGIEAPDSAVASAIREMPDFQEDGEFSVDLYADYVRDSFTFEREIRRTLDGEPLLAPAKAFTPLEIRNRLAQFRRQRRVVSEAVVTITSAAPVSEENIQNYYRARRADYQIREEADFEYVVFNLDEFSADVTVSEDDIADAYEDYLNEGEELQGRRASHIYILDDEERAESLAEQAKLNPDNFAELARAESEDAGSAELGGDLGFIARGDFPVAMEEAVFAMEPGEVRGPVEVDGGYSIIKLDEISALPPQPLSAVREEMSRRARKLKAEEPWLEEIERLRDIAYVEVGSLVSVAAAIPGGEVLSVKDITRNYPENPPPFDSPEVLAETFVGAVLRDEENSAPVPFGDDSYLFARVTRYQAPRARELSEVREEISALLRGAAAAQEMRAQLATLSAEGLNYQPPDNVEWSDQYTLSLADRDSLPEDKRQYAGEIFRANLNNGLPAYSALEGEDLVRVFRVERVFNDETEEEDFVFVDGLLTAPNERLANIAYLQYLSRSVDYQFYDLDTTTPTPLGGGY